VKWIFLDVMNQMMVDLEGQVGQEQVEQMMGQKEVQVNE
jgi:hypothetical protein